LSWQYAAFLLARLHGIAPAQGAEGRESPPPAVDYWSSFGAMLLALAVVVGLIILVVWLLKMVMGRKFSLGGGGLIQLVAPVPLGERRFISVLRVGERYYLIGISSGDISLLSTLEPEEVKPFLESGEGAAGMGFARLLRRFRRGGGGADSGETRT